MFQTKFVGFKKIYSLITFVCSWVASPRLGQGQINFF